MGIESVSDIIYNIHTFGMYRQHKDNVIIVCIMLYYILHCTLETKLLLQQITLSRTLLRSECTFIYYHRGRYAVKS